MNKVADRPHLLTIALSLLAVTVSALGVYFSNKEKMDKILWPERVKRESAPDDGPGGPNDDPSQTARARMDAVIATRQQEQQRRNTAAGGHPEDRDNSPTPVADTHPQPAAIRPALVSTVDDLQNAIAERIFWVSEKLQGRYHQDTADARAAIRDTPAGYSLVIDAPQAFFDCELTFGTNGYPESASSCKVTNKAGVPWWTDDRIHFTCASTAAGIVCQGPYTLHYQPDDKADGHPVPPRRLIMRIERRSE
jgi:hypothetical protein